MALIVASIVTYAGIIGFVGLICPHIVRLIIGADNRFLIPASCAFGAAFLLLADSIAKYLSGLDAVPVGAICGLIGAPIFLLILIHNRRDVW
jgi:iron complex transport system permease protein